MSNKASRYGRLVMHSVLLLVFVAGTILALGGVALKEVSICVEGSEPIVVSTTAWRVGGALARAGVELYEGDLVTPTLKERLQPDQVIEIKRAFPIRITADGETHELRTTAVDVQYLLDMIGLTISTDDLVTPDVNSLLSEGDEIRVTRVTFDHVTATESIAYKTVQKSDGTIDQGVSRVVKQGQNGTMEKTYQRRFEDGVEVSSNEVSNKVLVKPVDAVVHVGTRPIPKTIRASSGRLLQYTAVKDVVATAYTPRDGSGAGITYTGIPAKKGVVAVDPRVIPLGSRLYIPGYGEAIAADTGSAIKGLRVDLCYESRHEAIQFGRRPVKVYILSNR